jgi:hypothetical protein
MLLANFHYFCSMQFKKCTGLFLASLLLVSNIGLAFNVHFCGGKIADVSSVYNVSEVCEMPVAETTACCAKKATDHKKCCEDKTVDLQDDSDEVVVKTFTFSVAAPFLNAEIPLFQNPASSPEVLRENTVAYYCDSHSPPLFKLYSQFLLYA